MTIISLPASSAETCRREAIDDLHSAETEAQRFGEEVTVEVDDDILSLCRCFHHFHFYWLIIGAADEADFPANDFNPEAMIDFVGRRQSI